VLDEKFTDEIGHTDIVGYCFQFDRPMKLFGNVDGQALNSLRSPGASLQLGVP
jgi:hypothetical protein